ncbi:OmpA family protein [Phenylobacterium sp.]|uniref:OmpA family protein n=1 Tax=Phenylobacterium sp. TaxID=1871053 RepID=UPI002608E910|nr:OmpA family protein [Phenylobacterium sp.]
MSDLPDVRQDKAYRRGLVLGMTMAEVMILLIFLLLMALAAALQNRDQRIRALDSSGAAKLIEELQRAYPQARDTDDYFKELTRAIEARKQVEEAGPRAGRQTLVEDAALGREVREAAGERDPKEFLRGAISAAELGREGEWPPFFSLSEAGGYYFDSGKATLRPQFEQSLRSTVIPRLVAVIKDYDVDVIEVIGHTDEVPMVGQSNLDSSLISASAGRVAISDLRSTDNAGLAMARAVAVVRILRGDARLSDVTILPLSGGQMIVPVDRMAVGNASRDDQSRRRIEIRLRKSTSAVASQ